MDYSKPFRCHFSIIFENITKSIWIIIVTFLISVDDIINILIEGIDTEHMSALNILIAAGILIAIIGIVFLIFFLRWRKTLIHFEDNLLVINRNFLFSKKRTTIPLDKISTVDYSRNIFERVIGTCRLKLDVNSSVLTRKTDINLVFKLETAQKLRAYILNEPAQDAIKIQAEEIKPQTIFKFGFADIIKYTITDLNGVIIFILLAFSIGAPIVGTVITRVFGDDAFSIFETLTLGVLFLFIFLIITAIFLASIITIAIKNIIRFFDYTVSRENDVINISYGLINLKKYSLPVSKIITVTIKRSFLARLSGFCCVEVKTVGIGDERNESALISLSCKDRELNDFIKRILPEFVIESREKTLPLCAFAVNVIRLLITMIILYAAFVLAIYLIPVLSFTDIILPATLIFAGVTVVLSLFVFMFYKTKSIVYNDNTLMINTGVLGRKSVVVQNRNIQHTEIKQGPLTRLFGLCNMDLYLIMIAGLAKLSTGMFAPSIAEALSDTVVNCESQDIN